MASSGIALFNLADHRLAWLGQRQRLLAENIANADTPGWKTRDVATFAATLAGAGVALARTEPGHLAPPPGSVGQAAARRAERAPDGNTVALDVQLARVAETETAQELTTELYRKYLGLFRTALGR
jgi:flagellar basal-body rod protein FlgB